MSTEVTRLWLVGDDEALDVLAELARHLPLFELSRVDALPELVLGSDDLVVIGANHPRTRDALLRDTMSRGMARHVAILPSARLGAPGPRALIVACALVRVLVPDLDRAAAG